MDVDSQASTLTVKTAGSEISEVLEIGETVQDPERNSGLIAMDANSQAPTLTVKTAASEISEVLDIGVTVQDPERNSGLIAMDADSQAPTLTVKTAASEISEVLDIGVTVQDPERNSGLIAMDADSQAPTLTVKTAASEISEVLDIGVIVQDPERNSGLIAMDADSQAPTLTVKTAASEISEVLDIGVIVQDPERNSGLIAMDADSQAPTLTVKTAALETSEVLETGVTSQELANNAIPAAAGVINKEIGLDTSSSEGSLSIDLDMSSTVTIRANFEAFMERFEHEVYNAEPFPKFWEPNEPLVDFYGFQVPNVGVSFLNKEMEHHDFMENFTFGSRMGNYALSLLCKILMDMKYSENFVSETKILGWGTLVKDLMKAGLGLGFLLNRLRELARSIFSLRAKAELEALEVRVAEYNKLLEMLESRGAASMPSTAVTYGLLWLE